MLSVFFCGAVGRAAAGPAVPDKPLLHPLFSDEAVLQRGKPVRYAWADNPACNLANQAGLPAVPFRTDDWPGVTWPKPASTTR
jgi:hypothetical protein